jgi:hypothetical protein
VASNFATRWGSVGFFGPLTVRPDLWDRGVAKRLIEATMELFAKWASLWFRHRGGQRRLLCKIRCRQARTDCGPYIRHVAG